MEQETKRRGRAFWETLVLEFGQTRGMTQQAFAESKGVHIGTFRHWIYRLRQEQTPENRQGAVVRRTVTTRSTADFVELEFDRSVFVTVRLGNVNVDFSTVPPPAWVAELAAYGGR